MAIMEPNLIQPDAQSCLVVSHDFEYLGQRYLPGPKSTTPIKIKNHVQNHFLSRDTKQHSGIEKQCWCKLDLDQEGTHNSSIHTESSRKGFEEGQALQGKELKGEGQGWY